MGRKNRLSYKKNMERKKRAKSKHAIISQPFDSGTIDEVTLQSLKSSLELPDSSWSDHSPANLEKLVVCKISQVPSSSQLVSMTHCVTVNADLTWSVFIVQRHVDVSKCRALECFSPTVDSSTLTQLLKKVNDLRMSEGQEDDHFVRMITAKKGKVLSKDGKFVAYVDEVNGNKTVRTCSCYNYRSNLRAMYSKWSKRQAVAGSVQMSDSSSSHTNNRYLNTPEKKMKVDDLKKRVHAAEASVKRLKDKIRKLTDDQRETIDGELHSDLLSIMRTNMSKSRRRTQKEALADCFGRSN